MNRYQRYEDYFLDRTGKAKNRVNQAKPIIRNVAGLVKGFNNQLQLDRNISATTKKRVATVHELTDYLNKNLDSRVNKMNLIYDIMISGEQNPSVLSSGGR